MADTPLARAILELVREHGSDEKLAAAIGHGASRFTVMRWRVDGTIPEKPGYIDRLIELGIDRNLIAKASEDELATRRSLTERVAQLEGEVADLTTAVEAARQAHAKLLRRVAKLERAAPAQDARPEAGSKRRAQSGR